MRIFLWIYKRSLRTAPYLLSIIKLLVSTKLRFSAVFFKAFVPRFTFRSLLLFHHRELEVLVLFMQLFPHCTNIMVLFYQHRNPFNFVLHIFLHYSVDRKNYKGTLSNFFWKWNNLILESRNFDLKVKFVW